ncbi:hypothetical protein Tco_1003056 [Tanacetum coccineum]|uniref:Uncharacterized protein n=1 Tax=Tanacetum coccineum TaxID=301880 RepID=A0ABQ5F9H6_9ASTR
MLMTMLTKMQMRRKEVRWVVEMTKMQTPIPRKLRSPRTILSSDKNITQELTNTVPLPTTTTSNTSHSKIRIYSKYNHLPEDLIENNLKSCIAITIIEDRDAFRSEVADLVSQKFNAQAPKIIEDLFMNYVQSNVIQVYPTTTTSTESTSSANLQQQLYFKMKRSLQDRANDPALWEVLKWGEKSERHKASKSSKSARGSSSKHSAKDSTTYVSKQQQQQQWDAWVEKTFIDEDEVILEDETPELITELQDVDKHVPTIFDYERMKATLNDALSNDVSRDLKEPRQENEEKREKRRNINVRRFPTKNESRGRVIEKKNHEDIIFGRKEEYFIDFGVI